MKTFTHIFFWYTVKLYYKYKGGFKIKKNYKLIIILLSILSLSWICVPSGVALASQIDNDVNVSKSDNQNPSSVVGENIYQDNLGNVYTDSEVLVKKSAVDPRISARSMNAQPINIGILWTYTTKADGTKLRNMFRKASTAEGLAGLTATVLAAGFATGPIAASLAALVAAGGFAFHGRFNEGANLIAKHPTSGKIYMYLDHTTYGKL